MLSIRDLPISKRAEVYNKDIAARRTAESILKIMQFVFYRVPREDRSRFLARIKGKIIRINPGEVGSKTMPPSSVIGQSVGLTKNLLSGLNPAFIQQVLIELARLLSSPGEGI